MLRRLALLRSGHPQRGATAVEYGIMVGFIAVVIVLAVTAFGLSVRGLFELARDTLPF